MKRLLISLFVFLVIFVSGAVWFYLNTKPAARDISLKDFLIVKGSTASQIGNKLYSEGLLKSPLAFKLYLQLTSSTGRIQAGEYRLSPSFSLFRIIGELLRGPVEIWVTIPEGLRREEVAQRFASSFGQKEEFVDEFLASSKGQEGFLFPDTYLFPKTASPAAVLKKMRTTFDKKLDSQMRRDIESGTYDTAQIVTLASIIERETKTVEERPIVAGILYKRLKIGMPLQVDATLQYAVASSKCKVQSAKCEWWPQLTKEDLEIKSRYNTYKYPGLPPTPIASPGLSSIKAAVYKEDSPYWYYLHDSSGQIHYAKTIEEHNENVRKYLQK